jgi:hypothetical protein
MGPDVNVVIVWRRKAEREATHLFSYVSAGREPALPPSGLLPV